MALSLATIPLLFGIGLGTGAFGTLIGVGGGFILVPILLFLYPHESAKTITSISLLVVFFNALSGTVAYARMKRIDYRSGIAFALGSAPGAVLGALATSLLSRDLFHLIFGALLLAVAGSVFFTPSVRLRPFSPGRTRRVITERDGTRYVYSFSFLPALLLSFVVGFISSLLGIGGGVIHVPALVVLFNFPAHVAAATSQSILATSAFTGTLTHIVTGEFTAGWRRGLILSVGAVVGAQIGARLSSRVGGRHIIRLLAVALAIVGLRLIVEGLLFVS